MVKAQTPRDFDAQKAIESVSRDPGIDQESPEKSLAEYLRSGDKKVFNNLRFWKTGAVLLHVKSRLQNELSSSELDRILRLLKGYQSRQRIAVVDVLLTHWSTLSKADYATAVQVLTQFEVPTAFLSRAKEILNRDLSGKNSSAARKGLELLLR